MPLGRVVDYSLPEARAPVPLGRVVDYGGGAGFMTSFEGRRLHAGLQEIGARLDGVDQRDQMYKQQVAELNEVLEKVGALLTANSNDVASKTAKAETDIAALQALADRLAQSVAQQSRQRADKLSHLDGRMAMVEPEVRPRS